VEARVQSASAPEGVPASDELQAHGSSLLAN
jgi:hypothetical protein